MSCTGNSVHGLRDGYVVLFIHDLAPMLSAPTLRTVCSIQYAFRAHFWCCPSLQPTEAGNMLLCRFAKDHICNAQEGKGLEQFREVCESGLTAAGLHITQGHLLWNAYR